MRYDFFADEEDKLTLLSYIFNETDLQVFDLSSKYGEGIKEYPTVDEITSCFNLKDETLQGAYFQLWSPRFKGKAEFRKIELDPRRCNGHTFRYATEGWGLIQLYLHGINGDRLKASHIGHFNQAGAAKWAAVNKAKGPVDLWDWNVIQKTSSHLKYLIHKKLSVKTLGSCGVMAGAERLERKGLIL